MHSHVFCTEAVSCLKTCAAHTRSALVPGLGILLSAHKSLQVEILEAAEGTVQGIRADSRTRIQIDEIVQKLEALNPTDSPALSDGMEGCWVVDYSDAPPPSNGVLGPFVGIAYQVVGYCSTSAKLHALCAA